MLLWVLRCFCSSGEGCYRRILQPCSVKLSITVSGKEGVPDFWTMASSFFSPIELLIAPLHSAGRQKPKEGASRLSVAWRASLYEFVTWDRLTRHPYPFGRPGSRRKEEGTRRRVGNILCSVGGRSPELGELFSYADVDYSAKQKARESSLTVYNEGNVTNAGASLDSSDMTPSMQEALHRSNMDMRFLESAHGAEYVRKEVPLQVLPARYLWSLDSPLSSFTDMQHVLFEEERSAYKQAILQNMRLNPAISILQDRLKENEIKVSLKMPIHGCLLFTDTSLLYQLATLMEEAKSLEPVAQSVKSGVKSENPHHRGNRSSAAVPTTKESHDSAGPRSPSSIGSRRKVP
ncbi:hypothetical protein ZIOFF_033853 [Zingiber officinale]|uniref:Uncharacterized protein n=1 Tax=Zingiber officinale TaxID=94328 RepID=A0A8J5H2U9_ZINOF|nr:hypothetical protein ZIOFF_033853 [Zingiber officinale]